jgi:hypothetical protein
MHGASPAETGAATEFGSDKSEGIAQNPKQGGARIYVNGTPLAVDIQSVFAHELSAI